MNDAEFLRWIADRLVHVYGESDHVDFVLSLRERADRLSGEKSAEKFRVRHRFTGHTGIVMEEREGNYTIMWDAVRPLGGHPVSGLQSNRHVHPADEFDKVSMHPVRAYEVRPNALVYEVVSPLPSPPNNPDNEGERE